ncbi:DUF3987 domain-containing protein [Luteimonas sp. MC1825]|nr:DUF3987 domain-containing protein [Luteimonas sp. MC1825]QOC87976.1 DUF3987 domain-containing protein [Luteimonas sp. MC1825]
MKVWEIKGKIIEKRLRASLIGGGLDQDRLTNTLKEHETQRPQRPYRTRFLYQDTSLVALKLGLAGFPSACVHSTEGMSLLKGALFKDQTLLCNLYSGEDYFYDRGNNSISLKDKRLCVSAHSQPKRTFEFLAAMGDDFRDSGLAARMTVCLMRSTQGCRTYDTIDIPTNHRQRFNERVRELLMASRRAAGEPNCKRRRVKFGPDATREYLAYANWVEREMNPNGRFQYARDYANRLADKVGRFAAAAHVFEDFEGGISMDTLMAARSFYNDETEDFQYLFNYLPSAQFLADQLAHWLEQHPPHYGEPGWKKTSLQQRCFSSLRKKAALEPALAILEQQGRFHLQTINKTTYLCPGPRLIYYSQQSD